VVTSPLTDIDLDAVLIAVLTERRETVDAWLRGEPGSWGALAGQAVLAARRALGRRLTEPERRIVWQALWDRLCERRATNAR
jgi:hypothetical protein